MAVALATRADSGGINPLLHRLFLDHDIISIFRQHRKKNHVNLSKVLRTFENIKKNLSKVLHTFENIMENRTFAPFSLIFHKCILFQRCQKVLLWSKGLRPCP